MKLSSGQFSTSVYRPDRRLGFHAFERGGGEKFLHLPQISPKLFAVTVLTELSRLILQHKMNLEDGTQGECAGREGS